MKQKTYLMAFLGIIIGLLCYQKWHWKYSLSENSLINGDNFRIVDGDSINLGRTRFRLYGIDAPELKQTCFDKTNKEWPCGIIAKNYLESLVKGKQVYYKVYDIDYYQRQVAEFFDENGQSLNEIMVVEGLGVAYRKFSKKFEMIEEEAKRLKKGIWQGGFQQPEKWRKNAKREKLRKK